MLELLVQTMTSSETDFRKSFALYFKTNVRKGVCKVGTTSYTFLLNVTRRFSIIKLAR